MKWSLVLIFYLSLNSLKINCQTSRSIQSFGDPKTLKGLDTIFANKRIIFLGESSHTTKEFSIVKEKLIEHLHEELKFNIILFESGISECYNANKNLETKDSLWLLTHSIFPIWWSPATLKLMNYIKNQKMELAGFDYQLSGKENSSFIKKIIYNDTSFLNTTFSYDTIFMGRISKISPFTTNNAEVIKSLENITPPLITNLNKLSSIVASNTMLPLKDKKFVLKIIENRLFVLASYKDQKRLYATRDSLMAQNITWLCDSLYPNEKIIIWAANEHISKMRSFSPTFSHLYAGSVLPQQLKNQSYVIGLYAWSGEMYSTPKNFTIKTPHKKSLEGRINGLNTSDENTFINIIELKTLPAYNWLNEKTKSYSWGNFVDKIIPAQFYDGIILLHFVTSSRK